jgi:hypothetical protein
MIRLTFRMATLAPPLIQRFHITLENGFAEFLIDMVMLFTKPHAQVFP